MEIDFDQEARDWLSQESVEWLSGRWGLSQEASAQFLTFFNTICDLVPLEEGGRMNIGNGDPREIAEELLDSFKECLRIIKSEVGTESFGYKGVANYGSVIILKILLEYWDRTEKSVEDAKGIGPILDRLGEYELPLKQQILIKFFQNELPVSKITIVLGFLVIIPLNVFLWILIYRLIVGFF